MYAAKKFYEDIYLSFFQKDNKIYAYLCNDTSQDLHYELTVKFLKFDGTEYKQGETIKGSIISDGNKEIYSDDISIKDATEYFIYGEATVTNINGDKFVRDGTVFPGLYKHCDLADAKISCELEQKENVFEITVKADYPAFFVSFDTEGLKGKFSENMFTLLPNVAKTVIYTPEGEMSVDELKKGLSIYDLRHTY